MIEITKHLAIPEHELTFTASRRSGPGGQRVNKEKKRHGRLKRQRAPKAGWDE